MGEKGYIGAGGGRRTQRRRVKELGAISGKKAPAEPTGGEKCTGAVGKSWENGGS